MYSLYVHIIHTIFYTVRLCETIERGENRYQVSIQAQTFGAPYREIVYRIELNFGKMYHVAQAHH